MCKILGAPLLVGNGGGDGGREVVTVALVMAATILVASAAEELLVEVVRLGTLFVTDAIVSKDAALVVEVEAATPAAKALVVVAAVLSGA